MADYPYAVKRNRRKCIGCTTCMKHCPTEAIRIRGGMSYIIPQRCIDCGVCIRVCNNKARRSACDSMEKLKDYRYTIALPDPSLFAQFRNLDGVDRVLEGLLDCGFDRVYEVARAAELVTEATKRALADEKRPRPVISSACPSCVRLICVRFPSLIPNILEIVAPFEAAAVEARRAAVEKTGLKPEEIGVFLISPCPAKVTAARRPLLLEKPVIDGCISMSDIYRRLLGTMKKTGEARAISKAGRLGLGWAESGGEATALGREGKMHVDGIRNVIRVLENVEDGSLHDIDFIELNACNLGCIGGSLTVENPYIAREQLRKLLRTLPETRAPLPEKAAKMELKQPQKHLQYLPIFELEGDAMGKYLRIEEIAGRLPGLDCGSCGAPSCKALAEDVVQGYASEKDCIFNYWKERQIQRGEDPEDFLPVSFRRTEDGNEDSI